MFVVKPQAQLRFTDLWHRCIQHQGTSSAPGSMVWSDLDPYLAHWCDMTSDQNTIDQQGPRHRWRSRYSQGQPPHIALAAFVRIKPIPWQWLYSSNTWLAAPRFGSILEFGPLKRENNSSKLWRHDMEPDVALLAFCEENDWSLVDSSHKEPTMLRFGDPFCFCANKLLGQQLRGSATKMKE